MARKSILPGKDNGHEWTFASIGGVTRVTINNGADIAHLDELDQKLWTVLSCPVKGLEFEEETLRLMDFDGDDKIRVNEIVTTSKWLTGAVKNADKILDGVDHIALEDLTKGGDIIRSVTYEAFLPLIAVALIYLIIVVGLSSLVGKLERRLKKSDRG